MDSDILTKPPNVAAMIKETALAAPKKSIVTGIVFSKDRAMQLLATLESFLMHCRDSEKVELVILYKASNECHKKQYTQLSLKFGSIKFVEDNNFKGQVLSLASRNEYVLFLVDDNIFINPFNISDIAFALSVEKDTIGFSLRLGTNTTYCYMLNSPQKLPRFERIGGNILKYNWLDSEFDFGYSLEVSSSIYRTRDILKLLESVNFTEPNTLESLLNKNKNLYQHHPYLLIFNQSVTFCNPVNLVQIKYTKNRSGAGKNYSADQLADCFAKGMSIDIEKYRGLVPNAAHQEIELYFKDNKQNYNRPQPLKLAPVSEEGKPKFSIIMPNYNNSRFIAEAIQSVSNQTFKDWELIIVDDHSTDDSISIIKKYLGDKRIKLVQHDHNCGVAAALKTGIANICSEYYGILDSDDCLLEQAVEIMYLAHVSYEDCGVIYSQFIYCDENLSAKNLGYCKAIPAGKTNLDVDSISHFKTFKRNDYLKTSGYNGKLLIAEDKDIIFKMEEVTRLKFIDKCLYLYRKRSESLSHENKNNSLGKELMEKAELSALTRRKQSSFKNIVLNKGNFDDTTELYDISCLALESGVIDNFIKAKDEFEKGNFASAVKYIQNYKSAVDYSKLLQIKGEAPKTDKPELSVVIVTYNKNEDLKKCLQSLYSQDNSNLNCEIIVVNNGQSNFDALKQYVNLYVKCPINFNLSEGRNIGAHFAKGKILVFLDDDALAGANYLKSIKTAFDSYDIFGLRGRAFPKTNPEFSKDISIYNLGERPFPTYCNQEGNSAFLREIYIAMGGMDSLLFGHEGSDLTYRIIKQYNQPNRVIYWPATIIYHDFGDETKAVAKKVLHQRSANYLKYKHNKDILLNRKDIEKYPLPMKQLQAETANTQLFYAVQNTLSKPAPEIVAGNARPKVSVIIACHNCSDFLPQCLDSIQNQTMKQWELFLLDDASTDNTRALIEKYSNDDKRIRPYYFDDKKGPYMRRNFAIVNSASDFIVIQDADDIMYPAKLEVLYDHINRDKRLGIVGSFYRLFLDEFKGPEYSEGVELAITHDEIMEKYQNARYVCWHGSAIIRKSLFEDVGLYDEHPYGSDKLWLAKAAEYAHFTKLVEFMNIPECLTFKREHACSQQGVLPPLDPRSRRAKFQIYWEYKLSKIREKFHHNPALDVKTELRNCDCSDYIRRYNCCFDQWESEPLSENNLRRFIMRGLMRFKEGKFVSCVITLDGVERIVKEAPKRFRNFDLIRGISNFVLDRKDKGLYHLNNEWQTHNNPAARKFISEYYENQPTVDIITWCAQNSRLYDLRIIDTQDKEQMQTILSNPFNNIDAAQPQTIQSPVQKQPLVSVIMPAYNAQAYIAKAVESVLAQTYKDFELIIINDGSTDRTESIIQDFNDPRIKYFSQENHGLAATHNTGIKKSAGDFIIKLDADDVMTPDFIARHIEEFEKHPGADLIYCDDLLIDENDKPIRVIERPEYKDSKLLIRDLFRCGFPVVPFRTCVQKSVFEKIGYFDESLLVAEDYDMIRRFVKAGLKAYHLSAPLYLRRMTPASLSRQFTQAKAKSHFDVLKRFEETFECNELFPDMDWSKIPPRNRELHHKCLAAITCFAIGNNYAKTNSPAYALTAFKQACTELNECCKIAPDDVKILELAKKYEYMRNEYENIISRDLVCT